MMSKITVELDWETVDSIVVEQLRSTRESLKNDQGNKAWVFVWGDQEADDAEIQKYIDATELLLKWYSTQEQLVEMGLADDQK
jgi:hypothetical protein